jgi:hypothetical protein
METNRIMLDGKSYQKAQVVMLQCKEKAENCLILKEGNSQLPTLSFFKGYATQSWLRDQGRSSYHLYFVSDEAIKEGDWITDGTIVQQVTRKQIEVLLPEDAVWKIIATTDDSLVINSKNFLWPYHLPSPSSDFINAFIKNYNEGTPITDVLVEVDSCYICPKCSNKQYNMGGCNVCDAGYVEPKEFLEIDSHNTITIKRVKSEYSREEVIALLVKYEGYYSHLDDFIAEYL